MRRLLKGHDLFSNYVGPRPSRWGRARPNFATMSIFRSPFVWARVLRSFVHTALGLQWPMLGLLWAPVRTCLLGVADVVHPILDSGDKSQSEWALRCFHARRRHMWANPGALSAGARGERENVGPCGSRCL